MVDPGSPILDVVPLCSSDGSALHVGVWLLGWLRSGLWAGYLCTSILLHGAGLHAGKGSNELYCYNRQRHSIQVSTSDFVVAHMGV